MPHESEYTALELQDSTGPLSTTTPQSHESPPTLYCRWFEDGWAFEILSALLGTVLIIITYVLLRQYDGQLVPSFGSVVNVTITLNTVVSILLSISIPALLVPVSEAIGQLKWIWFARRSRPIEDLETFALASQGAMGAAGLIWRLRASPLASAGALLMIAHLAVSPLTQNSLTYPSRSVPHDNSFDASVSIIKQWVEQDQQGEVLGSIPDLYTAISSSMKGAIQTGLFSGNISLEPIQGSCKSGNCTIGPYKYLAVCSSLADITSSLEVSTVNLTTGSVREGYRYTLPGGHYLQADDRSAVLNISSAATAIEDYTENGALLGLNFNDSIAFSYSNSSIADVFFIYVNLTADFGSDPDPNHTFSAIEFRLDWCVQTFYTSVVNNNVTTIKPEAFTNFNNPGEDYFIYAPPYLDNNGSPEYSIDPITHYTLQRYFQSLLNGTVFIDFVTTLATSDVAQALWTPFNRYGTQGPELDAQNTNATGLAIILDNIATSMTNLMRVQPVSEIVQGTLIT